MCQHRHHYYFIFRDDQGKKLNIFFHSDDVRIYKKEVKENIQSFTHYLHQLFRGHKENNKYIEYLINYETFIQNKYICLQVYIMHWIPC